MTDKQLRKLKKIELLELLTAQKEENDALLSEIADLRVQLADRTIAIQESGSIAEAALRLNEVFEAAQRAADQYVENVKKLADTTE